ncbi:MAG: branched-chain amino acid ABC transporter permease [Hyphomicrobiaceae bacterium]|nr:MAG: branched-chain amino acid ABC transporter permease [Hyphomicrobiaceae bacterium]
MVGAMSVSYFSQQLINGALVSAFYGLLASAYVLMHGVTRRINLAFGALAMWAGYIVIGLALTLMMWMPGKDFAPVVAACLVAVGGTALAGSLIERATLRPLLRGGTLAMLIATIGIAIVLEEMMRLMSGSREHWLMPLLNRSVRLGGSESFPVAVTGMQIIVFLIALALAVGLNALILLHPFGRRWRAASEDLRMAELCGIDIGRLLTATFLLASAAAGAAGSLFAVYYGSVSFYGGLIIGLKTLFVAVIGGLNSVPGAFAGALLLGLFETFWAGYVGGEWRDVAAFAALALLLAAFPEGMFARESSIDHRWRSLWR